MGLPRIHPTHGRKRSTVSDFDYNPVVSQSSAARTLGQNSETLKKWRQQRQEPSFIQNGKNGAVRYSLNALKAFQGLPAEISIPDDDPPLNERDAAVIWASSPTLCRTGADRTGTQPIGKYAANPGPSGTA